MSLDLFDSAIRNADAEVARQAAPDLPSTFAENFDSSLRLSTEWNNSNNYTYARQRALASYYDDVKARTGESLPLYDMGGAVSLDELNAGIAKVAEKNPDQGFLPLSEPDIDTMTRRRMAKAHGDAEAINARERTWGGTFGNLAGGLVGSLSDPVVQVTLPLGGAGEVGVTARALEFAGIAGGTQAGTAALSYSTREAAVPGSSKEIPGEIASAALFGAGLGGAFGLLGKWLRAGEKPLPTSLREDVNAGASEAQFNATNVFDGAAGEAANRDAVLDTIDSILRSDRVTAGEGFDAAHVAGFADRAGATDSEALAQAADRAQRPLTHDVAPDVEAFDRVPGAAEDAASYWESRIAEASPEERAALGATDSAAAGVTRGVSIEFERDIPFADGGGARRFNINDAEGNRVGIVDIEAKDGGKTLEIVHIGTEEGSANRLNLGPRGVRNVLEHVREQYPDAETLTGYRISGAHKGETKDVVFPLREREPPRAPDLAPEQIVKLAADPETDSAVLRNLDRIQLEKPDFEFTQSIRLPDGTTQLVTRRLEDVLNEIDGFEHAGKELLACATGMMAAE